MMIAREAGLGRTDENRANDPAHSFLRETLVINRRLSRHAALLSPRLRL